MADVGLIITSVVFAILIILASVYFLVYFQHPDDKWVAWLPKIVVVVGLSLAAYNIFLLPLDVANQGGLVSASGGIPMTQINLAFFIATVVITIVIVPFTIFYYEGADDSDEEDEKRKVSSQVAYALKWMVPTLIFAGALVGVLWWFIGSAEITTTALKGQLVVTDTSLAGLTRLDFCGGNGDPVCSSATVTEKVTVSVLVYAIALTSFLGWILFSVFGGVGLVALPWDLILDYKYRPKPIKTSEYNQRKKVIGEKAAMMLEASKQMQEEQREYSRGNGSRRRQRDLRRRQDRFRKDVLVLEHHYLRMNESYKMQGGNALLQLVLLVVGVIGGIVSIMWIIHICIYDVPMQIGVYPPDLFLNNFFKSISVVPFVGIAFYALWSFWLLGCVLKGVLKLGMRIIFIPIHEMKVGETMMSSMIFNVGIVLLCSLSVTQFCTISFAEYARYTSTSILFGSKIQNLIGLGYVFKAFVFILLGFALLTIFYMIYRPQYREYSLQRLKY